MRKFYVAAMASAAIIASASPIFAQTSSPPGLPTAGKFSIQPDIGTAFNVGGDFVKSGSQTFAVAGTVLGQALSATAVFAAPKHSFGDVYDTPIQLGLGANYGLTDQDELYGRVRWLHADATSFNAMTITLTGTFAGQAFAGATNITGKFTDYNEYGVDLGWRHFFNVGVAGLHPFAGVIAGIKQNEDVKLSLSAGSTAIINKIGFYASGISMIGGVSLGARYDVASNIAVGLETGFRYESKLQQDTTGINAGSAGALSAVNGGGERWDIPVVASVTIRF